jgi:hypothetical protein
MKKQMSDFFVIVVGRQLIEFVGKIIRFTYLKMIGTNLSFDDLSPKVKDEYLDFEKRITQDYLNFFIGLMFIFLLIFIVGYIY